MERHILISRKVNKKLVVGFAIPLLLLLLYIPIFKPTPALASQPGSCETTLPTDKGILTFKTSVPSSGNYRLWSRILASSSEKSTFYVQVDSNCPVKLGGNLMPALLNTWTWIDYRDGSKENKADFELSKGKHTLKFAGDVDGLGLDKIMLLNSLCSPRLSGSGSDCEKPRVTPTSTPTPKNPTPTSVVGAPSNLIAISPSDSKAVLEWTEVEGATKYNVYIMESDDKDYRRKTTTSGTTVSFSDLNSKKITKFYVTAVVNNSESPKSNIVEVVVK